MKSFGKSILLFLLICYPSYGFDSGYIEDLNPYRGIHTPFKPKNYSVPYRDANGHNRRKMAEMIGEQGVARYVKENGLKTLLSSQNRSTPQGPDSIRYNPNSGVLHPIESKGGGSRLKTTFGYLQGTNQNFIKSAGSIIGGNAAGYDLKVKNAALLEAAIDGKMHGKHIQTKHSQGKPKKPNLNGVDKRNESVLAKQEKRRLLKEKPELKKIFEDGKREYERIKKEANLNFAKNIFGTTLNAFFFYMSAKNLYNEILSLSQINISKDPGKFGLKVAKVGADGTVAVILGAQTLNSIYRLYKGQGVNLLTLPKGAGQVFLPAQVISDSINLYLAYDDYSNGLIDNRQFYRENTTSGVGLSCILIAAGIGVGTALLTSPSGPGALAAGGAAAGKYSLMCYAAGTIAGLGTGYFYDSLEEEEKEKVNQYLLDYYKVSDN